MAQTSSQLADARARFEQLYRNHAESVRAFVLRRIGSIDAADIVSETFLIAWRRFDQVPSEPLPWLLGVARNVLANANRSQRRKTALLARLGADLPGIQVSGAPRDDRERIASAMNRLSQRDREALILVAWDGLTVAQAGTVVGCSPRTFSVRLHRARKRLHRRLAAIEANARREAITEEA